MFTIVRLFIKNLSVDRLIAVLSVYRPNNLQSTNNEIFFWILIISTKFEFEKQFSDWFDTKRNSV